MSPEPVRTFGPSPFQYQDRPRLVAQLGHSAAPLSVAVSADGRWAATGGSRDRTAVLWELDTGLELQRFEVPDGLPGGGGVTALAFSSEGDAVLAGTDGGTVLLWQVATGTLLRRFDVGAETQRRVAFSPDNLQVVCCGPGETLLVCDSHDEGSRVELGSVGAGGLRLAFSTAGDRLAVGTGGRSTAVFELAAGEALFTVEQGARVAQFLPDGRLVTAGEGTPKVWATDGSLERESGEEVEGVEAAIVRGSELVTASREAICRWNLETGELVERIASHGTLAADQALTPAGDRLVAAHLGAPLALVWDVREGREEHQLVGRTPWATALALAPGSRLATAAVDGGRSEDGWVALWNLRTGLEERRIDRSSVIALGFQDDGRLLIADPQFTHVVDPSTGEALGRLDGALVQGSAGRGAGAVTRSLKELLVHAAAGEPHRLTAGDRELGAAAAAGDGTLAAARAGDDLVAWEIATGRVRWRVDAEDDDARSAVAVATDGARVFAGRTIFDGESGKRTAQTAIDSAAVTSALFANDGSTLVTGELDGSIRFWDAGSGEELRRCDGHWDGVLGLAFDAGGETLFSTSVDGTVRLWRSDSGREFGRMISFRDGSWAVVDRYGRYDASNGGEVDGLHWVVAGQTIALEQLKERYYDPGLLAKLLGLSAEPLRDVSGFEELGLSLYPKVEILEAPTEASPLLRIRLEDCGGGIGRVAVRLNGKEALADVRPEGERNRGGAFGRPGETLEIEVDLENHPMLLPGVDNRIEVVAHNLSGHLASRGSRLVGRRGGSRSTKPPRLWAVAVGVSNYSGTALDLGFAAKDAIDFGRALESTAGSLFGAERVDVTVLTDSEATVYGWRRALEPLAEAEASDLLVLYFAGHGLSWGGSEGDYYYLMSDATSFDLADTAVREGVALSGRQITEAIRALPPLKQVLVLDTCAAGQVLAGDALAGTGRAVSSSQARSLERLKDRTGMFVLAGSAADAVSYETTRFGQGLLTYSLLLGIKGAALREDEFVDVATWFEHAVERVPVLARGVGGVQQPRIGVPRGGESFDIGRAPHELRATIPLPTERAVVVRANVQHDSELDDRLDLSGAITEALRTRGARANSSFVFVDARTFPDSHRLFARYREEGGELRLDGRLVGSPGPSGTGPATAEPDLVRVAANDIEGLAEKTAREIDMACARARRRSGQ